MASRFSRNSNTKNPKKVIRIYTEGESTEPNYFNAIKDELRLSEIDIKVNGLGHNTIALVEYVIDRKNETSSTDEDTEWWVVFDKDDFGRFNEAIEKAESEGIKVAYSNESFELWFILHFEFLQSSLGRDKFAAKITSHIGKKYEKNIDIYSLLKSKESDAIRNAKNLEKQHDKLGEASFDKRVPSTRVYELIECLRGLK